VDSGGTSKDTTDNSGFNRLYYIRFADDFMFGFVGSHADAKLIKEDAESFLQKELELSCNMDKSKIQHSSKAIKYLGTLIQ